MSIRNFMFIPPYDSLLHNLGTSREELSSRSRISIPVSLFKFLLQVALKSGDFNEAGYLADNPDIAAAIKGKTLKNAKDHYTEYGYFEGRTGASAHVDEAWYRRQNPDVNSAIRAGKIASGTEHYRVKGASEFRPPNEIVANASQQWLEVLRETPAVAR